MLSPANGIKNNKDCIDYIRNKFEENYPDNVPKEFVVEKTLKYLIKYIEECLLNSEPMPLYGLGKFVLICRTKNNKFQYYPKFKYSRSMILKIRKAKGSITEAETKELDQKRNFIDSIINKKRNYSTENLDVASGCMYINNS